MKNRITLTESQLNRIIKKYVNEALSEDYGEYTPTPEDIAWDIKLCVENNLGGDRYGSIINMLAKKVKKGVADVDTLANSQFLHKLCMDKAVDTRDRYRNASRDVRAYVRQEVAEMLITRAEDIVNYETNNQ